MNFLARWPAFVAKMKTKVEKNLDKNLSRSITDAGILERTLKERGVMALYRELAVGMFFRMAERIEGTKNDIMTTRTYTYPLKDIAVPTLVVHGTRDPLVPLEEHGRRLAAEIPDARLFVAEGGEHVTIFTHRAEVQAAVSAFLKGVNQNRETNL